MITLFYCFIIKNFMYQCAEKSCSFSIQKLVTYYWCYRPYIYRIHTLGRRREGILNLAKCL